MESLIATLRRNLRDWINPDHDDLRDQLEAREADAPLSHEERELLNNALAFRDVTVEDVSVPRSEVEYVALEDSYQVVLSAFTENRHSRMPVVGENLDDVQGFITLKDLLGVDEATFNLAELMRKPTFVPESMPIGRVLAMMRRDKVQMAIAVDEYGGTAGLVSLKDVLAELVGELEDENEQADQQIVVVAPGRWKLDPRLMLVDLQEQLNLLILPTDVDPDDLPYETVSGLLMHLAGRVPEVGYMHQLGNHSTLTVTETDGRRIRSVELKRLTASKAA